MRSAISRALDQATAVGGPPAWTLSNHDVHRTATRYGQDQELAAPLPTDMIAAARRRGPADLVLGVRSTMDDETFEATMRATLDLTW